MSPQETSFPQKQTLNNKYPSINIIIFYYDSCAWKHLGPSEMKPFSIRYHQEQLNWPRCRPIIINHPTSRDDIDSLVEMLIILSHLNSMILILLSFIFLVHNLLTFVCVVGSCLPSDSISSRAMRLSNVITSQTSTNFLQMLKLVFFKLCYRMHIKITFFLNW